MEPTQGPPRWLAVLLLLGVYLSCRGYHCRDGDQAYRLPLLLHQQDPALYRDDPFIRAFDAFQPHRGYLQLLDATSRPLGLSAALFALFAATFALTCLGIDRLARAAWPGSGPWVGVVAAGLVLVTKAGNIGTNHLFEAMLLDRLIALALGWNALAEVVIRPRRAAWTAPLLLAAAAWVHPSLGLQLALVVGGGWGLAALAGRWTAVTPGLAVGALALLGLGMAPTLAALPSQRAILFEGLDPASFLRISAYLQSPQHMIPHLWRLPQWLAWASFLGLAALSLAGSDTSEGSPTQPSADRAARARFLALLATTLAGLAAAWVAIEVLHDPGVTLFQPFRLATVARGLALVALAGRVHRLGTDGTATGLVRAALLVVGLTGDWALVVVALTEGTASLLDRVGPRWSRLGGGLVLAAGLGYLARHDTESGQVRLLAALGLALIAAAWRARFGIVLSRPRLRRWAAAAWLIPVAALVATALAPARSPAWFEALLAHCRYGERPVDAIERLGAWCRTHTPPEAVFIGPPGPKTFRLWSRRSLAFNRAGSPYQAAGIADWAARFQDHVGFVGPLDAFVAAYLAQRQELERGYDARDAASLAALARRQGADHVLARRLDAATDGPLQLLHTEGPWAVYRVDAATDEPGRTTDDAQRRDRPAVDGPGPG